MESGTIVTKPYGEKYQPLAHREREYMRLAHYFRITTPQKPFQMCICAYLCLLSQFEQCLNQFGNDQMIEQQSANHSNQFARSSKGRVQNDNWETDCLLHIKCALGTVSLSMFFRLGRCFVCLYLFGFQFIIKVSYIIADNGDFWQNLS